MSFSVLIPARLASTRLPNKALADICGLPMVVRVAQQAQKSAAKQVVVATDSKQIQKVCQEQGVLTVMTGEHHPSGSDRLAEAASLLGFSDDEIVVNVQGDEPLIDPSLINEVALCLERNPEAQMSTAAHPINPVTEREEFLSPHVVKLVLDGRGFAQYFSRSAIPHYRENYCENKNETGLRHIGIYAYRASFLRLFPKLPPAPTEIAESLEQLRALWHGHAIAVHISPNAPIGGVDTQQDLERVCAIFRRYSHEFHP